MEMEGMVTDVYTHILDDDRRKNAALLASLTKTIKCGRIEI